jgi:tetratricopeptide (TPR) repeat protein
MADLFVSYSSEDREYVAMIVAELEDQGWTVWWDRQIEIGSSFDKSIEKAIDTAGCLLVVWSTASINSDWVRAEAAEGLQRNILVPVLIDDVRPPLLFRQKQAVSLIDWKRTEPHLRPPLSTLIPTIETKLNKEQSSSVPVSTQRAWALDTVRDEAEGNTIGPALYEAAKLALDFFEGLFIYPGDMSDNLEGLVQQEGLDGVISIVVSRDGDGYQLTLSVQPAKVEECVLRATVATQEALIQCLGILLMEASIPLQGHPPANTAGLESYLGDRNLQSLYHAYQAGIEEKSYHWDQVKALFGKSIELDPGFCRARGGYSLACRYLGQMDECRENMTSAVDQLDEASPRQVHYFRGMYHFMVTEDMDKAADEFQQVIQLSPMDRSALNNLAVCRFQQLDFESASELSSRDLQLYPSRGGRLENASLFALYAGEFGRALEFAESAQKSEDSLLVAPLVPAMVEAAEGRLKSALTIMSTIHDQSTYGEAAYVDLLIATEDWQQATRSLGGAIQRDTEQQNMEQCARKTLMMAELPRDSSQVFDLDKIIDDSLALTTSSETLVSACLLCLRIGTGPIGLLARELRYKIDNKSRAYSKMASGIELYMQGNLGESIDLVNEGLELMDLWTIRFCLGCIYKESNLVLDARDQFSICTQRTGEGLFALLDDIATYRYLHFARSNV